MDLHRTSMYKNTT